MSEELEAPAPRLTAAQRHHLKFSSPAAQPPVPATTSVPSRPQSVAVDAGTPVIPESRLSPAERHQLRHSAASVIAAAAGNGPVAPDRPETGPDASAYDLLRAQLGQDIAALRDINSVEKKIEAKRGMLAAYDGHIEAVMAASAETGKAVQDGVFATLMIWHIDIGDYALGLDMAEYVITYGLALPERYNRNPETFVAEEVAVAALKALKFGEPFDIAVLQRAISLTDDGNVNDVVRAKLQKALGRAFDKLASDQAENNTGPAGAVKAAREAALTAFKRAAQLHDGAGVTKDIEALNRALAKA